MMNNATVLGHPSVHSERVALRGRVLRAIGAPIFAILMAVGASVYIPLPFTPVPITLQTLVLYVGAALLTRHYAGQMAVWYLGLGVVGAPMFAGGAAGLAAIAGPTGGYLVGFLAAALWIGYMAPRIDRWWQWFGTFICASIIIYVLGIAWLIHVLGKGWTEGLALGVYPFLIGDLTKNIAATGVFVTTHRMRARRS